MWFYLNFNRLGPQRVQYIIFIGVIIGFSFIIGFIGLKNIDSLKNVDNFAHFGGIIVGICLGIWFLKSEFEED